MNDSIILTIHNKAWLIDKVIERIFKFTSSNVELILIFDGCTDTSEQVAQSVLANKPKNFSIKKTITPNVFETKANNVGLKLATGDNLIIVQDDMLIDEQDWNLRLRKPIIQFDDIFAVTARTAHNWVYNKNNQHESLKENLNYCWCDVLIHTDHANCTNIDRSTFAIRDSVNRGPLLLKHDVVEQLNYLDEDFAPLDMDDHDLCFRAFKELGMKSGCYWIKYISEDSWGGTRVSGSPAKWLLESNHKNTKLVWERHKELILGNKHNENRVLK
jgi:glycosyltransferase involved in cell wall biosynthesis